MKRIIVTLLLSISLCSLSYAVTDKEMDEARAIAAQAYLRFANNGSGYLDDFRATSMSQLEGKLKPKEAENLKAFKAVAMPKDYASWDKDALVKYWGDTFFASKGLDAEGVKGRMRARKRISDMQIAASVAAQQQSVEAEAAPALATDTAAILQTEEAASEALIDAEQEVEEVRERKSSGGATWVYVLILAVLVGVVVWLVVFATNSMKKQGGAPKSNPAPSGDQNDDTDVSRLRSQFAKVLAKKDDELDALRSENQKMKEQQESLSHEAENLRSRLAAATTEISSLASRLDRAEAERDSALSQARKAAEAKPQPAAPAPAPSPSPATQPAAAARPRPALRTIYLGRANSKGIFVRADRQLNPGNTVFELVTTDGISGSFTVAPDRTVTEIALATPEDSLANACVCREFGDAADKHEIVNVTSGTAIFEGGCWRVTRKAQILLR